MKKKRQLETDRRRKHEHWKATIFYHDGETFARTYNDKDKAQRFAERQKKSPIVKAARVIRVT